jgi:cytochrome P450
MTGLSKYPTLTVVPSLPFFGTLLHQYSGTPKFSINNMYNYRAECRKLFGEFFTFALPGVGTGSHGTIHALTDPHEMEKVVRSEGSYPSGAVEQVWMIRKLLKEIGSPLIDGDDYGLFGNGASWKKQRKFLQTGMLDPRAAKRFVPGIQEAARLASKGAPARKDDLNHYLSLCAFDMFNTFMFGELTRCADPTVSVEGHDENIRFCDAATKLMNLIGELQMSPYEVYMGRRLGIKTKKYKMLMEAWMIIDEIARKKIISFIDRFENGALNDVEKASYLTGAINRQASGDSDISMAEMISLCISSLSAAVDTTSSVTAWCLVHLALNPTVQEALYAELSASLDNDMLTEKIMERASFPYLHAVLKESMRLTPVTAHVLTKRNNQAEVVVNGVTFPTGTSFALEHIVNDTRYISDADQFKPERWFHDAVEARKGTNEVVLDHPFFRDPFGQGARRCPGSRVATIEVTCMVSQLVLDYKIVAKEKSLSEIRHAARPLIQPVDTELNFIPR